MKTIGTCLRLPPAAPATGLRGRAFRCRAQPEPQLDPIERVFSAIFGKKALQADVEPFFNQKRINFDELKDQYVELERTAAPVDGDEGDTVYIRQLLANTQLEDRPLRVAYNAEEDGWSFRSFHQLVDSQGPAIVVCKSTGGAVFGGYNPEGWISLGEDRASNGAFLFTWPNGDLAGSKPIKLPKVGGPNLAVIDKPEAGPQFGAEGLTIPLQPLPKGSEKIAKSRLGSYYQRLPDGGRTLFGPGDNPKKCEMCEMKVYVDGKGQGWTLEGGLTLKWKYEVKE